MAWAAPLPNPLGLSGLAGREEKGRVERNAAGPTAGSRCGTRLVQLHTKGAPMSRVLARVGAERVCSCPGFPKNNDQPADLDFSVRTVSRHEEGGGVGDKSPTPE